MQLKRLALLAGGVLIVLLAALGWYVKSHGFSARQEPAAWEAYLARRLRSLASEPGSRSLKNPLEATPLAIAQGRDHFADHCALCHANNGSGKTPINSGLYPPAPDLRLEETQDLRDGDLFYIVKNGIRFTGMPGWGGEDNDNWKLVLFLRHLPELTPIEVEFMQEINHMEE